MADPSKSPPLTRSSVLAAHDLIKPYIHHTPTLTNSTLSSLASTPQSVNALKGTPWEGQTPARPIIRLWFKAENLQRVGAFKVRGAFHALLRLIEEEGWDKPGNEKARGRGVVTHSSGSFALYLSVFLASYTRNRSLATNTHCIPWSISKNTVINILG